MARRLGTPVSRPAPRRSAPRTAQRQAATRHPRPGRGTRHADMFLPEIWPLRHHGRRCAVPLRSAPRAPREAGGLAGAPSGLTALRGPGGPGRARRQDGWGYDVRGAERRGARLETGVPSRRATQVT